MTVLTKKIKNVSLSHRFVLVISNFFLIIHTFLGTLNLEVMSESDGSFHGIGYGRRATIGATRLFCESSNSTVVPLTNDLPGKHNTAF